MTTDTRTKTLIHWNRNGADRCRKAAVRHACRFDVRCPRATFEHYDFSTWGASKADARFDVKTHIIKHSITKQVGWIGVGRDPRKP